jgi:hypothetical protein
MKIVGVILIIILFSCQTKKKPSLIGSWKIESIATPAPNTDKFRISYDRRKVDSLALRHAMLSQDSSEIDQKSKDSAIKAVAYAVATSLHCYDSIIMTFNRDSTIFTENFSCTPGNRKIQKWVNAGNDLIRFLDPEVKGDTGVVFSIRFLSNNRMLMRQDNPKSSHIMAEYLLVRN